MNWADVLRAIGLGLGLAVLIIVLETSDRGGRSAER